MRFSRLKLLSSLHSASPRFYTQLHFITSFYSIIMSFFKSSESIATSAVEQSSQLPPSSISRVRSFAEYLLDLDQTITSIEPSMIQLPPWISSSSPPLPRKERELQRADDTFAVYCVKTAGSFVTFCARNLLSLGSGLVPVLPQRQFAAFCRRAAGLPSPKGGIRPATLDYAAPGEQPGKRRKVQQVVYRKRFTAVAARQLLDDVAVIHSKITFKITFTISK